MAVRKMEISLVIPPLAQTIIRDLRLRPPIKLKDTKGVLLDAANTFAAMVTPELEKQIKSWGFEKTDDRKSADTHHIYWKNEKEGLTLATWHVLYKGKYVLNIRLTWREEAKEGSKQDKHVIARKLLKFPDEPNFRTGIKRFKSKATTGFRLSSSATTIEPADKPIFQALHSLGFVAGTKTPTQYGYTQFWTKGEVSVRVDSNKYDSDKETFVKFTLFTPG